MTTTAPALTLVHDTHGTEIGSIRTTRDGTHIAARLTTDGNGYIPVGEYTTHADAENALTGRVYVRATRSATSPVVGYYEPIQIPNDFGSTTTHTEYRAHLVDGTPAGHLIEWGALIAPATNVWPTETKARAGIRAAHRHLTEKR
ncbi:hypothetical protein [Nocardiopsis synnemataformans]|uniref:hypothetical protein n=1 Tax=Nocardiopsis synnemataformans TaxID=61305 RepID=UPI003EBC0A37